jgi:hypothetical protein
VTLPVTFSAPGSYQPSFLDSLRFGVWLMMITDDVNRTGYDLNEGDDNSGLRIYQAIPHVNNGSIVLPQQVVQVNLRATRIKFKTGKAVEAHAVITVGHFEHPDESYLDPDVDATPVTPETRITRTASVLMRGTLFRSDHENDTRHGQVVDPYYSPLNEDGTYDENSLIILNVEAPDLTYDMQTIPGIAVVYAVHAAYDVEIRDRDVMARGGNV